MDLPKKFIIASILPYKQSEEEAFLDLKELKDLVDAYGGEVIEYVLQKREVHSKGHYLGKGKVEEISELIKSTDADGVILNAIVKSNQLFEMNPNGTGKKLLHVAGSQILDMSASPNGEWLAFTTRNEKEASQSGALKSFTKFIVKDVFAGNAGFGYPVSKLFILDIKTQKVDQIDTTENSTVRYPRWFGDSAYLTFWQNDGQASRVYSLKDKKFVLEVTSDSQEETVSPVVFVPGKNKYGSIHL